MYLLGHDSPETIATQLTDFCRGHFLQGEYVRIDINPEVRYWGEVVSAVHGMRPDGSDSSEYKVSLAAEPSGSVIGEASFVGTPPFTRLRALPNKTLIKRFIRSCASRTLFPGSPWIVNAELVKKYRLKTELPAHLAEAAMKAARSLSVTEASSATSLPLTVEVDDSPRIDEEIDQPTPLPAGKPHPDTNIDALLDVWAFCQAFGPSLRLAPFSLKDLCQAVAHDELPNPILEGIHVALTTALARERKSRGGEAILQLLLRTAIAPELIDEDDMEQEEGDEEDSAVLDLLDKQKWWETSASTAWWAPVAALLREAAVQLKKGHWLRALLAGLQPTFLRAQAKGYLTWTPSDRARVLQLLVRMAEGLPLVRQHVDAQLETALEARKDRRQLDIDRNRLLKEIVDAEREYQEASTRPDSDSKQLRALEAALRKQQTAETQLARKSEAAFKEERKASAFRIVPYGSDRDYRRYWWLDFHLLPAGQESHGSNLVLVEGADGKWSYFDEESAINGLLDSLNTKGARECRLKMLLQRSLPLIVEDLRPHENELAAVEAEEKAVSESDEEEEILVVQRRGRKPKLARRASSKPAIELPAFLRYRNTLMTKK